MKQFTVNLELFVVGLALSIAGGGIVGYTLTYGMNFWPALLERIIGGFGAGTLLLGVVVGCAAIGGTE